MKPVPVPVKTYNLAFDNGPEYLVRIWAYQPEDYTGNPPSRYERWAWRWDAIPNGPSGWDEGRLSNTYEDAIKAGTAAANAALEKANP